ncbi:MAG: MgtC/SapB family protein [Armatimonadota bacterium]
MDYAELLELFTVFGISLLLGAFIGLERERREMRPLGIRSFIFIAGTGTVAAFVAEETGMQWVLPAAFLVIGALILIGHIGYLQEGRHGLTTELAAVMTFAIGIIVQTGPMELAVALGVVTAAVLHFKPQLHALADRAGSKDIFAMLQFGLVAFIVLPVLPDETYGPFDVLNPYNIWLMVVLISGINLAGYIALKLIGSRYGGVISGLLGGLVSSTATTFSFSRRAHDSESFSYPAALAIILASAVAVPRMAVEIGVVNSAFLAEVWLPLLIVFLASLAPFAFLWFTAEGRSEGEPPEVKNPVQIGAALIFGALYGLIMLGLAAADHYYGDTGTYVVSVLSGLTDVDAITLSTARLVGQERIGVAQATDVIVIAFLSNMLLKGGLAAFIGNRKLGKIIAVSFGFTLVVGVLVIVLL